jgi:cupin fold WbuC family metalloprotein
MFIAKLKNTYVRPHKNHNKCKSFQVLDGIIDLVIFDNFGNITDVVNLGNYGQKNSFFYRLTNTCFHSLIIRSNYAIFKETITGPFNSSDTIYAEWAPMENDEIEVKIYMDKTLNGIKYFLK